MERERIFDRNSKTRRRTVIRESAGDTASTCGIPCGILRALVEQWKWNEFGDSIRRMMPVG